LTIDTARLTANRVGLETLDLIPAWTRRGWMDDSDERFANRCLPLLVANQSGWFLTSKHMIRAAWDGRKGKDAISVEILAGAPPCPVTSHFGGGVLTWSLPWLFQTAPGWNLLVRGPANWPKDGIYALEGLVETDWSPMTFTVNWIFTRPFTPVTFEVGEPICMIVPQRRNDLEMFDPAVQDVTADAELAGRYSQWHRKRGRFIRQLAEHDPEAVRQKWQRDYFRGRSSQPEPEPEHQMKRSLRRFKII
jgi:hypothetical protein